MFSEITFCWTTLKTHFNQKKKETFEQKLVTCITK